MKILFPIAGLFLLGCNSPENKTNNSLKNSDTVTIQKKLEGHQKDSLATQQSTANENTMNLIKLQLGTIFKDELSNNLIDEQSRKFKFFEHNINDDPGKEIFIGLTGPYFCGSGGCTLLLLHPNGELITKFTVTEYPISITNTSTKGWKNLVLHSNGQDHLMKFNGKSYPSNPSMQTVYDSTSKQDLIKGLTLSDQAFSW